ncbi:hypothetical protein B0H14DRAFT_2676481 [Mycena olivaceomarginata]|nr:hypothetical protein B0H14DRAFT_2676481 [Mycena olivaceomarginata]
MSDWRLQLYQEGLYSWINAFYSRPLRRDQSLAKKYVSTLINIWNPCATGYSFTSTTEELLGLTYAGLSEIWEQFGFSASSSLDELMVWLHCCLVVLYPQPKTTSVLKILENFCLPLQNSLIKARAAARCEVVSSQSSDDDRLAPLRMAVLEDAAHILEDLAHRVGKPMTNEKLDRLDRVGGQLGAKLEKLNESYAKLQQSVQ